MCTIKLNYPIPRSLDEVSLLFQVFLELMLLCCIDTTGMYVNLRDRYYLGSRGKFPSKVKNDDDSGSLISKNIFRGEVY
jgi:hypothetical protein